MTHGFLQGFHADDYLIEVSEATVTRYVLEKAVEIAMLGLVDECNAICQLLAEHGQFDSSRASLPLQCIWLYSDLQPPVIEDADDGTVWIPSEADIQQQYLENRKRLTNLPRWCDWEHVNDELLTQMRKQADDSRRNQNTGSWMGVSIHRASVEYAAALYMADELDRSDVIAELMPVMTSRIHCYDQARMLSCFPRVWKEYLLNGWLREQLSLSKEVVQEYATYVLDTVRERFEHGPRRPLEIYHNSSVPQLLDIIDQNTVSNSGYVELFKDKKMNEPKINRVESVRGRRPYTILQPGATTAQVMAAEKRVYRPLPNDLKEFFRLSNGCSLVSTGHGFYKARLPPVDKLSFEARAYMRDYNCEVVPQLPRHLGVEWQGIEDGGISMYEADGQGTVYVWIIGPEDITRSKEQLQRVYDETSADNKAIIDRYIQYWYGSREKYDAMTDYCYIEVRWGHGAVAVYPDFQSYVAMVACKSRHYLEQSPLKVTYDSGADELWFNAVYQVKRQKS